MTAISPAKAARLRKLAAYGPGPSLFRDHNRSRLAPLSDAGASLVASMTASWAAHAAAGEYPVIVGNRAEWRKAA